MKIRKIILTTLALCAAACALQSCDDWTEQEGVGTTIGRPDTKDPAAWAAYAATVRAYKKTAHTLVYASMLNAPDVSLSERDFLRSLPDSLDIVSLRNAPSAADLEDLDRLHKLGTRVLYGLGPDGDPALAAATIARHGFDGVALIADRPFADLAATLRTLGEAGLVSYEGDPSALDAASVAELDLVVLPTAQMTYLAEMDLLYDEALRAGVPASKILFGAMPGAVWRDYKNAKQDAMTLGQQIVTSRALAGISLYDIGRDYYHTTINYRRTRELIARLNLMPKN